MSVSTSEAPKEEQTVKKEEGKKGSEEKGANDWKGGEIVWAKVPGFNYWPGKVCSIMACRSVISGSLVILSNDLLMATTQLYLRAFFFTSPPPPPPPPPPRIGTLYV